jgi:hypothetical protein
VIEPPDDWWKYQRTIFADSLSYFDTKSDQWSVGEVYGDENSIKRGDKSKGYDGPSGYTLRNREAGIDKDDKII